MLSVNIQVALGDGVRIELFVTTGRRIRTPDATVDHEMCDVNAVRRKFPRRCLSEAAQAKLAHRE